MDLTIIYYTDGSVKDYIGNLVRSYISKAGVPIISVSQEPIDFGTNICVGKIGRSFESIHKQTLTGAKAAKTKYIALAEHDTLYPDGYFDWLPPSDDTFYYNKNRVFVVAKKGPQYGMYIYYDDARPNADQLICNRELFIEAIEKRLALISENPPELPRSWCEPGVSDYFEGEKREWRYNKPHSVDILHNDNFTARVGTFVDTGYELDGWGPFKEILCME